MLVTSGGSRLSWRSFIALVLWATLQFLLFVCCSACHCVNGYQGLLCTGLYDLSCHCCFEGMMVHILGSKGWEKIMVIFAFLNLLTILLSSTTALTFSPLLIKQNTYPVSLSGWKVMAYQTSACGVQLCSVPSWTRCYGDHWKASQSQHLLLQYQPHMAEFVIFQQPRLKNLQDHKCSPGRWMEGLRCVALEIKKKIFNLKKKPSTKSSCQRNA